MILGSIILASVFYIPCVEVLRLQGLYQERALAQTAICLCWTLMSTWTSVDSQTKCTLDVPGLGFGTPVVQTHPIVVKLTLEVRTSLYILMDAFCVMMFLVSECNILSSESSSDGILFMSSVRASSVWLSRIRFRSISMKKSRWKGFTASIRRSCASSTPSPNTRTRMIRSVISKQKQDPGQNPTVVFLPGEPKLGEQAYHTCSSRNAFAPTLSHIHLPHPKLHFSLHMPTRGLYFLAGSCHSR